MSTDEVMSKPAAFTKQPHRRFMESEHTVNNVFSDDYSYMQKHYLQAWHATNVFSSYPVFVKEIMSEEDLTQLS